MGDGSGRDRVALLDCYRIVAAVGVLLFHLTFNGYRIGGKVEAAAVHFDAIGDWTRYGSFGVQFFFLISGFTIFLMAEDSAGAFARRRFVRLYPTFWICVTITAIFAAFLGGLGTSTTLPDYLASLTMFAAGLGYKPVDGVYWTLVYEMQFYFAVFLVYLLGGQRWRDTILTVVAAALLIILVFKFEWPLLSLKSLHLYGFFAGGALIAVIHRRGFSLIPLALVIGLCAVGAAHIDPILVCLSYAAMLLLTIPGVARLQIPGSFYLGAATYPLYLLHAHIGYMVISHIATPVNKYVALAGTVALIIALTIMVQFIIDQWFKQYASRFARRWIEQPIDSLSRTQGRLASSFSHLPDLEHGAKSRIIPFEARLEILNDLPGKG